MGTHDYPLLIKNLMLVPLRQPNGHGILYRDRTRTDYKTFGERVGRLGSALAALGVRKGDTVAVMDWDTPRYLESFFAIPMIGAVLQTVNVRLPPEQVQYTLEHAEASVILCNIEFLGLLKSIRPKLRGVRKVICMSGEAPSDFQWDGEYEQLLAAGNPAHEFPDFDENTCATTFYTTGTTGLPKGVSFSHRQIVLQTLSELYALQGRPTDVYMPLTPLFHVHAWGMPYSATAAGLQQIYPGRYAPDLLVKLLKTERVTVSHCVPTVLQMILSSPAARDYDFKGWRVIIGASALSKALCQEAMSRGIDVNVAYGMSATCPCLPVPVVQPAPLTKPPHHAHK